MQSVLENTYAPYRVYIIDQTPGCEPAFAPGELAADRVTYVRTEWSGKSRAVNHALAISTEPIIAFTDDDCTVPPDWLEKGVAALRSAPSAGILFGTFRATAHDPAREFVPEFVPSRRRLSTQAWKMKGTLGYGGNMFATREALAALGGFDEELGPGGRFRTGEDTELTYRALRRGVAVLQDPAVEATHFGGRPLADGSASQWVGDAYFALGASYGKHLRRGDGLAGLVLLREFQLAISIMTRNVLRGRVRESGARRVLGIIQGAWVGFTSSRLPVPGAGTAGASSRVRGRVAHAPEHR